jgi:hypothetical protein
MRYEVTADCIDLNQKFQKAGSVVSVPDGEPVPKWFKPIDEKSTSKSDQEVKQSQGQDPRNEEQELMKLKMEDLFEIAGKENVDIPIGAKKAEVVKLIRSHRRH